MKTLLLQCRKKEPSNWWGNRTKCTSVRIATKLLHPQVVWVGTFSTIQGSTPPPAMCVEEDLTVQPTSTNMWEGMKVKATHANTVGNCSRNWWTRDITFRYTLVCTDSVAMSVRRGTMKREHFSNMWKHTNSNEWILFQVFRWFKFTLKPPYSIAHDKLRLAIWDTSFWTFWLKFGHKGPWDIS